MTVDRVSEQLVGELQIRAGKAADSFMVDARMASDAKAAADWSLAAKNAISVALSCEHLLKVRNGGR